MDGSIRRYSLNVEGNVLWLQNYSSGRNICLFLNLRWCWGIHSVCTLDLECSPLHLHQGYGNHPSPLPSLPSSESLGLLPQPSHVLPLSSLNFISISILLLKYELCKEKDLVFSSCVPQYLEQSLPQKWVKGMNAWWVIVSSDCAGVRVWVQRGHALA